MATDYSKENGDFSFWVHSNFAVNQVYPKIFSDCEILKIEHQNGNDLDLKEKVDVLVTVQKQGYKAPRVFKIQERWRKKVFETYQDVTITEWNHETGKAAEFYEGSFDFFLYGYFDEKKNEFGDIVFFDYSKFWFCYLNEEITQCEERPNERSVQTFKTFRFNDLHKAGCLLWSNKDFSDIPTGFVANATLPMDADYWRRLYFQKTTAL